MIIPNITAAKRPANIDFAIIDLAADGQMLAWVYEQMRYHDIRWESLYRQTEWQGSWKSGPILVDLRDCEVSHPDLIEQFEEQPKGVFLSSVDASLDSLAKHFKQHVLVTFQNKPAAMRFYEPRNVAEFLTVLTEIQRDSLIRQGDQWTWYDSQDWLTYTPPRSNIIARKSVSISLTNAQIKHLQDLKRRKRAQSLAHHYRNHIHTSDPVKVIFNHLTAAMEAGLDKVADQERWLRLALKMSSPLQNTEKFLALADDDELTPRQRLSRMEDIT